jgi:hypothetical protein
MEKYKKNSFDKTKKKINATRIYLPAFALYTNMAINTIEELIKPYKDNFRPRRTLKMLCENIDDIEKQDEITYYVNKFKDTYPFINHIIQPADTDKDCLKKIYTWVRLLKGVRNLYSHSIRVPLHFDEETAEKLQNLYDIAVEKVRSTNDRNLPNLLKYKSVFVQQREGLYLTYTGIIFFTSLFLRIQDVSAFLGSLIQMAILRDDRNGKVLQKERKKYQDRFPDTTKPYPRSLRIKNKDFLYRSEVYMYWAIRGCFVSSIDKKVKDQIRFFELMEYLKQCPLERVNMEYKEDVPQEQQTETCILDEQEEKMSLQVIIHDNAYKLREKNNFINYALEYWEDQLTEQFPSGTEWKWARFSSEEKRQENRRKKNFEKLNFQETVIWDKPQQNDGMYNEENETTFPYYVEMNNIFFRLKKEDSYIVGMMSVKVLYDLLRNYFSVADRTAYINNVFEETWKYLNQYLNYTHTYKEQNSNLAVPKKYSYDEAMSLIRKEGGFSEKINVSGMLNWSIEKEIDDVTLEHKIKQRVNYLKTYYEQIKQKSSTSQRVTETIRAWFAILNYGKTTNWAHAFNVNNKDDNSIISQYKYITYYLSRLAKPNQRLAEEFDNYLSVSGLKELLLNEQPDILSDCQNLKNYFSNVINYRLEMLHFYEELLAFPFDREKWKPVEALRWLKIRVPERAREYPKHSLVPTQKIKLSVLPSVLNGEKGVYFAARAVPLPHNFYTKTFDYKKQEENVPIKLLSDFYDVNMKLFKAGHFRKLYLIKQQDMVLSHITAYYAEKLPVDSSQSLTLSNNDYQSIELSIPYTINAREITVCYYYPYFKRSYYKLSTELLIGLLETALQYDKIPADGKIYFNNLQPQKDENGKIIFKIDRDIPLPTVWSLWKRYTSSRMKFIDHLLGFEKILYKKYNDFPLEITYIPFGYYVYQAKKDGMHDVLNNINEMRTAALYGKIALPLTRIKNNGIDFFGEGSVFIRQVADEIRIERKYKRNNYY